MKTFKILTKKEWKEFKRIRESYRQKLREESYQSEREASGADVLAAALLQLSREHGSSSTSGTTAIMAVELKHIGEVGYTIKSTPWGAQVELYHKSLLPD